MGSSLSSPFPDPSSYQLSPPKTLRVAEAAAGGAEVQEREFTPVWAPDILGKLAVRMSREVIWSPSDP